MKSLLIERLPTLGVTVLGVHSLQVRVMKLRNATTTISKDMPQPKEWKAQAQDSKPRE